MRMPKMRKMYRILIVAAVGAAAVGTSVVLANTASAATTGQRLSRYEVLARAQDWVFRKVPYSQTSYAKDADGSHTYRQDCSGYVSMVWHLGKSYDTDGLASSFSSVSKSNLAMGDILVNPKDDSIVGHSYDGVGHTVIFHKWANADHTSAYVFEEPHSGEVATHHVSTMSRFSSYVGRRYSKVFSSIEGAEIAAPSTAGAKCNSDNVGVIHLTGRRNVQINTNTCVRSIASTTNGLYGWVTVSWKPATGADDSTSSAGSEFDGFQVNVQIQRDDATVAEGYCWIGGNINAATSGSRACRISDVMSSGSYTADGFLNWDENSDGMSYVGARYIYGSPAW